MPSPVNGHPRTPEPPGLPVALRGLTPTQRALVERRQPLSPGERFFPHAPMETKAVRILFVLLGGIVGTPVGVLILHPMWTYRPPIKDIMDGIIALVLLGLGLGLAFLPVLIALTMLRAARLRRDLPGAGLYLLTDGAMRVYLDRPPVVVPRETISRLERVVVRRTRVSWSELWLYFQPSPQGGRHLALTDLAQDATLESQVRAWLDETAPSRASEAALGPSRQVTARGTRSRRRRRHRS